MPGPCLARLAGARARELYLRCEATFAELGSDTPMLSDDLLARIAQEFYATVLDSDAKARMRGARITEQVRLSRSAKAGSPIGKVLPKELGKT